MVICVARSTDYLHMVLLMPLPPSCLVLHYNPDWFNLSGGCWLTQVVLEKRPLNGCVSVCLIIKFNMLYLHTSNLTAISLMNLS